MMDYRKMPTTPEVWGAIMLAHREKLVVFSSFSNPTGDSHLGNGRPEMFTEYGFRDADCPLIGARTTWERGEKEWDRVNEDRVYWLCLPLEAES